VNFINNSFFLIDINNNILVVLVVVRNNVEKLNFFCVYEDLLELWNVDSYVVNLGDIVYK